MRAGNLLKKNFLSIVLSSSIYIVCFLGGSFVQHFITFPEGALEKIPALYHQEISALGYIKHNLLVTLPLYLSFLLFGLFAIFILASNGFFLGAVATSSLKEIGFTKVFICFAPHSIFELPATMLAGAAGFKSLEALIRHLRGGDFITKGDVKEFFKLVFVSVVLIIIAGFVEANITPIFL